MKVCFFGIYNPDYSRNRILISGFKKNSIQVFECRVNPSMGRIKKFISLYIEYKKIKDNKFDYVIVAFPGHSVVWLARLLFGKKIIFDAFLSIYNSNVNDRELYNLFSLRAFKDWCLDWSSCMLSDKILLDTNEHIKYFSKTFNIKKDKFIRVFVGSDEDIFYPKKNYNGNKFIVHFHGSYIPLQGVEYILGSAKELEKYEDIEFNIIGTKIKEKYRNKNYENINFINSIKYNELSDYINKADVCLGIFGNTPKAEMVIPNKLYESIACRKPVITSDTLAIKELFYDNKNIILCEKASSRKLAEKITLLKFNKVIKNKVAKNSFSLFKEMLTPKILVKKLLNDLKK